MLSKVPDPESTPSSGIDRRSEHRQSVRIEAAERRVLALITQDLSLKDLLTGLVQTVESHCRGSIGSVLLLDEHGRHLSHGAAPGLDEAYSSALDGVEIGPAVGSCGTAAYRRETVVVEDIETDPLWADYRDLARLHGLRACWSEPILAHDASVLGTFAMYYRQPRSPRPGDREFLTVAARLAGVAIEVRQSGERRRVEHERIRRQGSVLVELAHSEPCARGDFKMFCKLATGKAADTLQVGRASVWLFGADRTVLRCHHLYDRTTASHSDGPELLAEDYPRYFASLERGRTVSADDARTSPDTSEFADVYLAPLGITSMLDAPLRRGGSVVGVLCCEHIGPQRRWAPDEKDFAASVADLMSLGLEASERRRAERAFRSAQEELLRQQWQARQQAEAELARTRDDLVRQTRMATIGHVAASIAHELRNPLAAIQNAAYLLRRRLPEADAKSAEYVSIVEQEVRASDAIVSDLLEMSRAKQPEPVEVDLARIVREAIGYVKNADGVRLQLVLNPDPFVLRADPALLRQVLANLFANAAQAMDGAGELAVEARRTRDSETIRVSDSGPGVPDGLRERIFEPLFTTRAKGTGLGLAICRQIVERHGGTLRLDAGAGTVFEIRLPRPEHAG